MKRIVVVGLACLVVTGCGEKEITKKMLVGDWKCTVSRQVAKWENGAFQDFDDPIIKKELITFKMYEEILLMGKSNDSESHWHTIPIPSMKSLSMTKDFKSYVNYKMEYISDNEFKEEGISEFITYPSTKEERVIIHRKNKYEKTCIKIKN